MKPTTTAALERLRQNVRLVFRGDPRSVELALAALLSRGHILIEDVPGVGKTTLARAIGRSLSLEFRRIQFTSDTLPADVLGISVYHAPSDRFEFHAGPIFANIVLADEINRATPKTQSALLEAMNEGAVTVESERRELPQPFMVVATQNPVEYLGTYPLPESQMDRFFLRLGLGYPDADEEKMLLRRGGAERALAAVPAVLGPEQVLELQDETEAVTVSDALLAYIHAIVSSTRKNADLRLPVSTRGAQSFYRAVQAWALLAGREYATPDDVQAVAEPVLSHRILSVASDGFGAGGREREIVKKILAQVAVPV
ncbi:MAG TPA: MoxR family ATPase [Thermoanaerobaculia bacterium]